MNPHPVQWKYIKSAFDNQRVPQAMLFVGPLHCALSDFVTQIMQLFLCKRDNAPCLECIDCHMVHNAGHPDITWVKPEKNGGAIKIDQVRALHETAYLTSQRSRYRVIAIDAADRMNTASSNALLKILEEPAQHTLFILIAQQLSTVLPTVLSRCQIITFSSSDDSYANNLLMLGDKYANESERGGIVSQAETLLDQLIGLVEEKLHPCILASQWTPLEFPALLWFLYLVYAQLQHMLTTREPVRGIATKQLNKLMFLLNPVLIFSQIDKINALLRKLSHNMNVNHTLALEDLLFSLVPKA